MNKRLVIVGARAMGRETCAYAWELGFEVGGFLDDNPAAINGFCGYPPVIGSVEGYNISVNDVFVIALGDPAFRRKYAEIISAKGGEFATIVHPTAYVGKNVRMDAGCIICPNSTITNDVDIGSHVIVNVGSTISHDCVLGDYTTLSPGCHVAGGCKTGNCVFMGVHSAIVPRVVLGDGVFVAAGAVVVKSVADGRVMGVPAMPK